MTHAPAQIATMQRTVSSADETEQDLHQDIISQFPFLNGHSHFLLGFATASDLSRDDVVAALQAGVNELLVQVPWLGGHVRHIPGPPGDSGVYEPAMWPPDAEPHRMLHVKDCTHAMPSMDQLIRDCAPISQLNSDLLTPWPGLPRPHGIEGLVPIVQLQANFIQSGLLLVMSLHHNVIDGTGITQFMRLLALTVQGRTIPPDELVHAHLDRRSVIPLLPHGEPIKDHRHLYRDPDFKPGTFGSPPKWCYFLLSFANLAGLRKLAQGPAVPTIATQITENDIICAFCWQRITVMRLSRSSPRWTTSTISKFGRAIDARMAMGIPLTYMGHMVYHCAARRRLGDIATAPLADLARTLRRSLAAVNQPWAVRSFATFMAREPDKSSLLYGGPFDPTVDMISTAFTALLGDAREAVLPDFGPPLGPVRFFRRPNVTPLPGSITMTQAENGYLPVVLCLPQEDLDWLRKDPIWRKYMKYVG